MTAGNAEQDSVHVQVRGTVLTVRRVDAYHAMTVVAPGIAARFRPGQFVAVAVGGPDTAMLLRRAFSIHDAMLSARGEAGVDRWLSQTGGTDYGRLTPGDGIDL